MYIYNYIYCCLACDVNISTQGVAFGTRSLLGMLKSLRDFYAFSLVLVEIKLIWGQVKCSVI